MTKKTAFISCLAAFLDAGQGQIAALEVQDNSSIWLAASAIGIEPRGRRNRIATQEADARFVVVAEPTEDQR